MITYFITLESLVLHRSAKKPDYFNVVLDGRDQNDRPTKLHFDQASEIQIGHVGPNSSLQLGVTDIRHWQREEARFSVSNEEYGDFSFKCFDFLDLSDQLE